MNLFCLYKKRKSIKKKKEEKNAKKVSRGRSYSNKKTGQEHVKKFQQ